MNASPRWLFAARVGLIAGGLAYLVADLLLPHLASVFHLLHLDSLHQALCYPCAAGDPAGPIGAAGAAGAGAAGGGMSPIPRPPSGPGSKPPTAPSKDKGLQPYGQPPPQSGGQSEGGGLGDTWRNWKGGDFDSLGGGRP